jgi:hypothetical protein
VTPQESCCKNKKPAGVCDASGLKSVLISDLLSTPERARRIDVMMMVAVGVANVNHEREE